MWYTINSILEAQELQITFPTTVDECITAARGFASISCREAVDTCVCAVDGYHLQIRVPSIKEASNIRPFYSGHYSTYGVNVQGACDHYSRFLFLGVAGPGVMGDCDALFQCPLGEMIEQLPGLFCDIGDCTYTPTEHLVPIFGGALAKIPSNNNFNFYASQRRIRSKMAFGVMIQKWGIHQKPLTCKLKHVWKIVVIIACLHNFCINQRLANNVPPCPSAAEGTFTVYEEGLRAIAAVCELND